MGVLVRAGASISSLGVVYWAGSLAEEDANHSSCSGSATSSSWHERSGSREHNTLTATKNPGPSSRHHHAF